MIFTILFLTSVLMHSKLLSNTLHLLLNKVFRQLLILTLILLAIELMRLTYVAEINIPEITVAMTTKVYLSLMLRVHSGSGATLL